jgi:hypothetical protein
MYIIQGYHVSENAYKKGIGLRGFHFSHCSFDDTNNLNNKKYINM